MYWHGLVALVVLAADRPPVGVARWRPQLIPSAMARAYLESCHIRPQGLTFLLDLPEAYGGFQFSRFQEHAPKIKLQR